MLTAETVDLIVRFDGEDLPVRCFTCPLIFDPGIGRLAGRIQPLDSIDALARDPSATPCACPCVPMERIREAVVTEHWRPGGMATSLPAAAGTCTRRLLPRRVRNPGSWWTRAHAVLPAVLDEHPPPPAAGGGNKTSARFGIHQDDMREAAASHPRKQLRGRLAQDRVAATNDEAAIVRRRSSRTVWLRLRPPDHRQPRRRATGLPLFSR